MRQSTSPQNASRRKSVIIERLLMMPITSRYESPARNLNAWPMSATADGDQPGGGLCSNKRLNWKNTNPQ
jgi:hypothetical protein